MSLILYSRLSIQALLSVDNVTSKTSVAQESKTLDHSNNRDKACMGTLVMAYSTVDSVHVNGYQGSIPSITLKISSLIPTIV